jgi:hypothetical protein
LCWVLCSIIVKASFLISIVQIVHVIKLKADVQTKAY